MRYIPCPTRTQALSCGNTFAFATANLNLFIISIAVIENVPLDAELHKRATFSTLIVGLAGTGDETQATCVARSGANRSAIQYDSDKCSLAIVEHKANNATEGFYVE
jgi:hypothetical protein